MNPLDPTTTAKLLALPSLREQAEMEYRARGIVTGNLDGMMQAVHAMERLVRKEANLLADLTRWQSQAWALREIANLLELDPTDVAIGRFYCGEHCCNGQTGEMVKCDRRVWSVGNGDWNVNFSDCPGPENWDGEEDQHIPGIPEILDRPAAIAAILLHLSERA